MHELYSLVHVEGSLVSREALHEGSSGGGKGEIPLIVIVSVAICGTVLLLLNIVLISCFVHKRRQQQSGSHGKSPSEQKQNPPSEGQYFHFFFVHLKFICCRDYLHLFRTLAIECAVLTMVSFVFKQLLSFYFVASILCTVFFKNGKPT